MAETPIYTNYGQDNYSGWLDDTGREWDSHARLDTVLSKTLAASSSVRVFLPNEGEDYSRVLESVHAVHDPEMVSTIRRASEVALPGERRTTEYDHQQGGESGVTATTYESALASANAAYKAATALMGEDTNLSVSLSRPPGHHAGREYYHGFCYFNNAAVAASRLGETGKKVAILDIDVHHGDGTQDIFYDDPNILFVSMHADPDQIFPHTGRRGDIGTGNGIGTTLNLPFDIGVSREDYLMKLREALAYIKSFGASYLVVSAGFDTNRDEFPGLPPLTQLSTQDYTTLGMEIGDLHIPTAVILEGGYNLDVLGESCANLIMGMSEELNASTEANEEIASRQHLPYELQ